MLKTLKIVQNSFIFLCKKLKFHSFDLSKKCKSVLAHHLIPPHLCIIQNGNQSSYHDYTRQRCRAASQELSGKSLKEYGRGCRKAGRVGEKVF